MANNTPGETRALYNVVQKDRVQNVVWYAGSMKTYYSKIDVHK